MSTFDAGGLNQYDETVGDPPAPLRLPRSEGQLDGADPEWLECEHGGDGRTDG